MSNPNECDHEIFREGQTIAVISACRIVAEKWVSNLAEISGQRVDWHYAGGRAEVLMIGDRDKVNEAINDTVGALESPMLHTGGQCRCGEHQAYHDPGSVLQRYP